jgi:hypothetical protein
MTLPKITDAVKLNRLWKSERLCSTAYGKANTEAKANAQI